MTLSARQHAGLFYSRERVRSLRALPVKLYRTNLFDIDSVIPAATISEKSKDFTFNFEFIMNAVATGELLRFGDSAFSTIVRLAAGTLFFESGPVGSVITGNTSIAVGSLNRIVGAVRPTRGSIRLWVGGRQQINIEGDPAILNFMDSDAGQYGQPVTDVEFVSSLGAYQLQVPRHYNPQTGQQAAPVDLLLRHATELNFTLEFYPLIN